MATRSSMTDASRPGTASASAFGQLVGRQALQPADLLLHAGDLVRGQAQLSQLGADSRPADLVQLVQRDEEGGLLAGRDAAVGGQRQPEPPVRQPDGRAGQPDRGQRLTGRLDQLRLGQHGRLADHVDVALVELPVAALLRPLRPPHRSDLEGPERRRQRRVIVPVEPGQRDREVIPQPEVDQFPQRSAGRDFGRQAPAQHLVDELLVVCAFPALQPADVLQCRGLDPLVPEPPVHRRDRLEHMVADRDVSGQQIPHPPGRTVVDLHGTFPRSEPPSGSTCKWYGAPPRARASILPPGL